MDELILKIEQIMGFFNFYLGATTSSVYPIFGCHKIFSQSSHPVGKLLLYLLLYDGPMTIKLPLSE